MSKWISDTDALIQLIEPVESGTCNIVELHGACTVTAARFAVASAPTAPN